MEKFLPNPKLKLREQLREVMRFKQFSHRMESAYWHWIRGFILFHHKRHPRGGGDAESGAQRAEVFLHAGFGVEARAVGEVCAGEPPDAAAGGVDPGGGAVAAGGDNRNAPAGKAAN